MAQQVPAEQPAGAEGARMPTHSHAVHVALDDVEGVPQVAFCYVEDDVSVVGRIHRHDGPEKDDLCERGAQRGKGCGAGPHQPQKWRRWRRGLEGLYTTA